MRDRERQNSIAKNLCNVHLSPPLSQKSGIWRKKRCICICDSLTCGAHVHSEHGHSCFPLSRLADSDMAQVSAILGLPCHGCCALLSKAT